MWEWGKLEARQCHPLVVAFQLLSLMGQLSLLFKLSISYVVEKCKLKSREVNIPELNMSYPVTVCQIGLHSRFYFLCSMHVFTVSLSSADLSMDDLKKVDELLELLELQLSRPTMSTPSLDVRKPSTFSFHCLNKVAAQEGSSLKKGYDFSTHCWTM